MNQRAPALLLCLLAAVNLLTAAVIPSDVNDSIGNDDLTNGVIDSGNVTASIDNDNAAIELTNTTELPISDISVLGNTTEIVMTNTTSETLMNSNDTIAEPLTTTEQEPPITELVATNFTIETLTNSTTEITEEPETTTDVINTNSTPNFPETSTESTTELTATNFTIDTPANSTAEITEEPETTTDVINTNSTLNILENSTNTSEEPETTTEQDLTTSEESVIDVITGDGNELVPVNGTNSTMPTDVIDINPGEDNSTVILNATETTTVTYIRHGHPNSSTQLLTSAATLLMALMCLALL